MLEAPEPATETSSAALLAPYAVIAHRGAPAASDDMATTRAPSRSDGSMAVMAQFTPMTLVCIVAAQSDWVVCSTRLRWAVPIVESTASAGPNSESQSPAARSTSRFHVHRQRGPAAGFGRNLFQPLQSATAHEHVGSGPDGVDPEGASDARGSTEQHDPRTIEPAHRETASLEGGARLVYVAHPWILIQYESANSGAAATATATGHGHGYRTTPGAQDPDGTTERTQIARTEKNVAVNGNGTVGVVTGAAHGMGRTYAGLLANTVDALVLVDLDEQGLGAASEELAGGSASVSVFLADMTDLDGMRELAQRVSRQGRLRAVAHAAGISPTMADWRRVLEVDAVGTAKLLEALRPLNGEGTTTVCFSSMADDLVLGWDRREQGTSLNEPLRPDWADAVRRGGAFARGSGQRVRLGEAGGACGWSGRKRFGSDRSEPASSRWPRG